MRDGKANTCLSLMDTSRYVFFVTRQWHFVCTPKSMLAIIFAWLLLSALVLTMKLLLKPKIIQSRGNYVKSCTEQVDTVI